MTMQQAPDEAAEQAVEIFGRRTSLFTRVALLFAEALRIPYRVTPIADMTNLDPVAYGGNPALKMPVLKAGSGMVLGTENICRTLARRANAGAARIAWPEHLDNPLARNAHELVSHCMSAQVQLVMGTIIAGLPADNVLFAKTRAGMESSLNWLDQHVNEVVALVPLDSDLSLFEVTLFCLVEHLTFRGTLPVAPYPSLVSFAQSFAQLDAARATAYRVDAP